MAARGRGSSVSTFGMSTLLFRTRAEKSTGCGATLTARGEKNTRASFQSARSKALRRHSGHGGQLQFPARGGNGGRSTGHRHSSTPGDGHCAAHGNGNGSEDHHSHRPSHYHGHRGCRHRGPRHCRKNNDRHGAEDNHRHRAAHDDRHGTAEWHRGAHHDRCFGSGSRLVGGGGRTHSHCDGAAFGNRRADDDGNGAAVGNRRADHNGNGAAVGHRGAHDHRHRPAIGHCGSNDDDRSIGSGSRLVGGSSCAHGHRDGATVRSCRADGDGDSAPDDDDCSSRASDVRVPRWLASRSNPNPNPNPDPNPNLRVCRWLASRSARDLVGTDDDRDRGTGDDRDRRLCSDKHCDGLTSHCDGLAASGVSRSHHHCHCWRRSDHNGFHLGRACLWIFNTRTARARVRLDGINDGKSRLQCRRRRLQCRSRRGRAGIVGGSEASRAPRACSVRQL